MGSVRDVRILSVTPYHPPRRSSANTMGVRTREDGAESTIEFTIDLGLKSQTVGNIKMDEDEAFQFLAEFTRALATIRRVNRE